MGKITKAQTKKHDEAMDLIHSDKLLTVDDVQFCYQNYNPLASHNVGKGAIYFTPVDLAWEFAVMTQPKGAVIDLCAGIGVLSYQVLRHDYGGWMSRGSLRGDIKHIVAIEQNHEFVTVGKRLLPEVEWIEGNVFDLDILTTLGEFDCAIGNPPYGNIPSKTEGAWLKTKGPVQWMVLEVALRLAYNGGMFILPSTNADCDCHGKYAHDPESKHYLRRFPGVHMPSAAIDISAYKDEWVGAAPNVAIVDLNTDDALFKRPYGFDDVIGKLLEF